MTSPQQDQPNPHPLPSPRRIMVIYGTRPEAVKVAPLIRALDESEFFTPLIAVTAQHRAMLDQVNDVFGIKPEFDLDIHQPGQTLTDITTRALRGVQAVLHDEQPDAVVVQGDTTTGILRPAVPRASAGCRNDPPGAGPARGRRPHGEPDRAQAVRGLPASAPARRRPAGTRRPPRRQGRPRARRHGSFLRSHARARARCRAGCTG